MNTTSNNQLTTYNPLKTVDQQIGNLVYVDRITDLLFYDFLKHTEFNVNQFAVHLKLLILLDTNLLHQIIIKKVCRDLSKKLSKKGQLF